ncbi:hypothetical protein [Paludibacterium paludis]|uniref:hypothetical protein n=1 Tax=Paludibacterium paludis TaxID=1225769 RepID=UPI001C03A933
MFAVFSRQRGDLDITLSDIRRGEADPFIVMRGDGVGYRQLVLEARDLGMLHPNNDAQHDGRQQEQKRAQVDVHAASLSAVANA